MPHGDDLTNCLRTALDHNLRNNFNFYVVVVVIVVVVVVVVAILFVVG